MQFYIVHPDPATSAKLLPDYALFKVNLREGWQILSDIGHIHDVHWAGQNRLYSESHALTRSFCSDPHTFDEFLQNYRQCLREYHKRKGVKSTYSDKFFNTFMAENCNIGIHRKIAKDKYESVRRYLVRNKKKHLSGEDFLILSTADEPSCIIR